MLHHPTRCPQLLPPPAAECTLNQGCFSLDGQIVRWACYRGDVLCLSLENAQWSLVSFNCFWVVLEQVFFVFIKDEEVFHFLLPPAFPPPCSYSSLTLHPDTHVWQEWESEVDNVQRVGVRTDVLCLCSFKWPGASWIKRDCTDAGLHWSVWFL